MYIFKRMIAVSQVTLAQPEEQATWTATSIHVVFRHCKLYLIKSVVETADITFSAEIKIDKFKRASGIYEVPIL